MLSVSGQYVPETQMRGSLKTLARRMALALSDSSLRASVYRAIHESPAPQGQLHFRSFLESDGLAIANRMTSGRPEEITSTLDKLFDLEFYMPVAEHREAWDGGSNLLVATDLRDGEIPIAFDLNGNEVVLNSAYDAPTTPTLGIVRSETDFERLSQSPHVNMMTCDPNGEPGEPGSCDTGGGGSSGGGSTPPPAGIEMTFSAIYDTYEGFLHGKPEFEVYTLAKYASTEVIARPRQCAGEDPSVDGQPGFQSNDFRFNQDSTAWSGSVLLFSDYQVSQAENADGKLVFYVIEDDNEKCVIKHPAIQTNYVFVNDEIATLSPFPPQPSNMPERDWLGALESLIAGTIGETLGGFLGNDEDDLVGILVAKEELGVIWTDATHGIVSSGGNHFIKGRVNLNAHD